MAPRPRIARKLLVASIGVAAIAYAGCEKKMPPGNLMPPPPPPPTTMVVGNLVAPPTTDEPMLRAAGDAGPTKDAGKAQGDAGATRLPAIQVK